MAGPASTTEGKRGSTGTARPMTKLSTKRAIEATTSALFDSVPDGRVLDGELPTTVPRGIDDFYIQDNSYD